MPSYVTETKHIRVEQSGAGGRATRFGLIVFVVALVVMGRMCRYDFTSWDDIYTISHNPLVNPPTAATLKHYWTHEEMGLYIPGTYTVWSALARGGRLHGCVRTAEGGAAVAPYSVKFFFSSNGWRNDPDVELSVADPSGCFTLNELEVGDCMMVVLAPGHAPSDPSRVTVPPPPQIGEVEVRLGAGGMVTGVALDERTGAPLPGAMGTSEYQGASATARHMSGVAVCHTQNDTPAAPRSAATRMNVVRWS